MRQFSRPMRQFSRERYSTSGGKVSIHFDFDGSYIDFEDGSIGDQVRGHYSEAAWVDLQQGGWEDWGRLRRVLRIEGGLPLDETNAIIAKAQQQRARWVDESDRYYSGTRGMLRRAWEVVLVAGFLVAFLGAIFWIARNVI